MSRLLLPRSVARAARFASAEAPVGGRRHWERRLMPCPPGDLFRLVADVDAYSQFVPWCLASRVVSRRALAAGEDAAGADGVMRAELEVGFKMISARYESEIKVWEGRRVRAQAVESGELFKRLVNEWEFKDGPEAGTTWLTFLVEFEFASRMYQSLSDLFFDDVVRKMVGAFEQRWLDIRGAGRGARQREMLHRW